MKLWEAFLVTLLCALSHQIILVTTDEPDGTTEKTILDQAVSQQPFESNDQKAKQGAEPPDQQVLQSSEPADQKAQPPSNQTSQVSVNETQHEKTEECTSNRTNFWSQSKGQCIPKIKRRKRITEDDLDILNATRHFITQGYDPISVPEDLDSVILMMLPDVLFEFNSDSLGNLQLLAFSPYSDIYRAKFNKSKDVVVKIFKSALLESITETGIIVSYLQPTVPVARILGLVRLHQMVGLVTEYLPNAVRFSDVLQNRNMTATQLVSITLQIVEAVHGVHKRFVLVNDLLAKNILVNFTNKKPKVKFIDFAQATFRFGAVYSNPSELVSFVAPELSNTQTTTPATDVYSLGDILRRINRRLRSSILNRVAMMCMQEVASKRPSARQVHLLLSIFFRTLKIPSKRKVSMVKKPPTFDLYLFDRPSMQKSVPLISHSNLYIVYNPQGKKVWLRKEGVIKVFMAELHSKFVVVKTSSSDFDYTRQEALILQMMNDTETIPRFHGLFPTGQKINSFGLVSDLFGKGVTLDMIVSHIGNLSMDFQITLILRMFEIVQTFHDRGLLINNIGIDNFIIDNNKTDPKIRIVGLNSVSGVDGILTEVVMNDIVSLTTTAPEVKVTRRTSIRTDWYSIGYALLELQLHDAVTLQAVLLYKDCIDKDVSHCPSLTEVKKIFQKLLESSKDPIKKT